MDLPAYDTLHQMQQLLSELDAAERELARQRSAVDDAVQRISAAEQEVNAARENAQRAYGEMRRRESELALLQASFAPTLERRDQLAQSLEQRRAALEEAHQKRLEGEEQAACIVCALEDLNRSAQESEARRTALCLTIEQLQAELAELDERIASDRAGREHLAREHASFVRALDDLRNAESRAGADLLEREYGARQLDEATANAKRELDALAEILAEVCALAEECDALAQGGASRIEEYRGALALARRRFTEAQEQVQRLRSSRREALETHLTKLREAETHFSVQRAKSERIFTWLCATEPLSPHLEPATEPSTTESISVAQRLLRDTPRFAKFAKKPEDRGNRPGGD